jgi:mutator protein MutT
MKIYTLGIIEKDKKILFLLRKHQNLFNNHYGLVGGKIEPNESPADALIRELYEEVNITVTKENILFSHCASCRNENGEEFMALLFKIINWRGEPLNKEPEKHAELTWFSLQELPDNIIPRHKQFLQQIEQGLLYSEHGL